MRIDMRSMSSESVKLINMNRPLSQAKSKNGALCYPYEFLHLGHITSAMIILTISHVTVLHG